MTNITIDENIVTQISKEKNEPQWMLELRLKALELYKELPLPHLEKTKIDKWNIDQFHLDANADKVADFSGLPEEIKTIVEANTGTRSVLVQRNSTIIYQQISDKLAEQGVIFTDLDTALAKYPDLVKKYFMQSTSFDDNKLIALHTALWNDGIFLYVPKNIEVEFPIQSLFIGDKGGLLPHIILVAEANSSITYVDNYYSLNTDSPSVHNGVVEVFVGDGARVQFASIHNLDSNYYDYTHRKAIVERNGSIEWNLGEMNSGNTLSNVTSNLANSGASAITNSIFIGTSDQKANFVYKVVHNGQFTESDILSRGVLLDESTGIFNGVTEIKRGAAKSDASQAEKVLMLSPSARGDANPILIIDEHDVKAGHAASAGPVNSDDIYYLMSRGISENEAKRLIIHGFLAPVVSRIPIEGMKEQLEKVIERKLKK